ncbi:hypothetical protein KQ875_02565 [Mycoplasma zalophi]|uniref:Type I restriction modification DNA specificity domain-containing protein n=1 Tax=Mycoplasma zalophi TaxID=191287 RepID=A0ABS6DQP3_9MOLU|nr:hypothetical protein [Mycoplasma zalophi]MBU4692468.1 hypothetical protein [Mycoplasma zalophi]
MQKRKDINFHVSMDFNNITRFLKVSKYDFVLHLSTFANGLAFSEIEGVTSPAYRILRTKDTNKYNPYFLNFIFTSNQFINKLVPITFGLRVGKTIKFDDLVNVENNFTLIEEQNKIVCILNSLNSQISLLKRLWFCSKNQLFYVKKTAFLLKNTFVWFQDKVENLLNYTRPDKYITKLKEPLNKGKIPVLTANKSFILGYTNESNYYDSECIIFDDFTLLNKYVNFKFLVKSSAIKILNLKKIENNLLFIFNVLNSLKMVSDGHNRHYIQKIQKLNLIIPEYIEQNKIALFSKLFDTNISLLKRK